MIPSDKISSDYGGVGTASRSVNLKCAYELSPEKEKLLCFLPTTTRFAETFIGMSIWLVCLLVADGTSRRASGSYFVGGCAVTYFQMALNLLVDVTNDNNQIRICLYIVFPCRVTSVPSRTTNVTAADSLVGTW